MRLSAAGSKKVQGVLVLVLLGYSKELKNRAIPLPSVVLATVAPVAKQSSPPLSVAFGSVRSPLPPHAERMTASAITERNLCGVMFLCTVDGL